LRVALASESLRVLWPALRPYRWQLLLSALGAVLVSGSSVPALMLVERASGALIAADSAALTRLMLVTVVLYGGVGLLAYGHIYLTARVGQRLATAMRLRAFRHTLALPLVVQQGQRLGESISRIHQDIEEVQRGVERLATRLLRVVFMPPVVLGYLLYLDWRLTLLTLVVAPPFLAVVGRLGRRMHRYGHRNAERLADLTALLQETLHNAALARSCNAEDHELARFAARNEAYYRSRLGGLRVLALQRPLIALLQLGCMLLVVWYGGQRLASGALTVEALTAFFVGIGLLVDALGAISGVHLDLQQTRAAVERYADLLARPAAPAGGRRPLRLRGELRLEAVGFHYPGAAQAALMDVNLTVAAGETVAVVGPSGAGKTTLVNLLPRLLEPTSGCLWIDGQDSRILDPTWLREHIAVVSQDTALIAASLRDNIAYARPDAREADILRAARAAHVLEFAERLPDGLDTPVGERGWTLSGGQRQRLALARAFLRDPRILILDEITAHLDAHAEAAIQDALARLLPGRTALIIAHRLSTARIARRIVVMAGGRVVESGDHAGLLARDGHYAALYRSQQREPAFSASGD